MGLTHRRALFFLRPGPEIRVTSAVASVLAFSLASHSRRIKDHLVVLPKLLEEIQRLVLAAAIYPCGLENCRKCSLPVNQAQQPVLESVDGTNEIGICMRLVDQ